MTGVSRLLFAEHLQTGYFLSGRRIVVSAGMPELAIDGGKLVCLLGANGSGKSTLLRTLAGLQPALGGSIVIGGAAHLSAGDMAKNISLVLTDKVGGTNLNVYSLVALGRYPWSGWLGRLDGKDRAVIDRAIDAAGIGDLLERKVHTLSDGESQKVMLARALAQDTPLLMLDEPTAHLDLPSRIRLMRLLHTLTREMNKGILLSTHELDLALQVADELWLLQAGGGLHKGAPEDMVLQGVFEAAFAGQDVVFDRTTGVFRVHPEGGRAVRLEGSDARAFWTRRALQREGYTVVTDPSPDLSVHIVEEIGATRWIVDTEAGSRSFGSIADLLRGLREK
ncbi:MAG TPA: ABC transporter ATP-binding protein [Puia sp.]|nr:ABC transporter ATP-binding protein [Puia sp.]